MKNLYIETCLIPREFTTGYYVELIMSLAVGEKSREKAGSLRYI